MLHHLHMEVVGTASDWLTTLAHAPRSNFNMLVVDWDLLPENAAASLSALRRICSEEIVIILTSYLDAREQAAESAGADAFISKGEIPNRIADRLRAAAKTLDVRVNP
jgi:DNA-binding NarL/FixJ family response regulator